MNNKLFITKVQQTIKFVIVDYFQSTKFELNFCENN